MWQISVQVDTMRVSSHMDAIQQMERGRHMATSPDARVDVRLPTRLKDLIREAAELSGQTITDFVISTLSSNAQRIVHEERLTVLSDRDRDIFLKLLVSDAKPNEALRKAARTYANNTRVDN